MITKHEREVWLKMCQDLGISVSQRWHRADGFPELLITLSGNGKKYLIKNKRGNTSIPAEVPANNTKDDKKDKGVK